MARRGEFKITGDKALMRALTMLPPAMQRRVIRVAIPRVLKPMATKAKALAPERKREGKSGRRTRRGLLKSAIGIRTVKLYKRTGVLFSAVGIRPGFESFVGKRLEKASKYGHIQEFGSEHVRGKRFLTRAFRATSGYVLGRMKAEIYKGIGRETERARRKSGAK